MQAMKPSPDVPMGMKPAREHDIEGQEMHAGMPVSQLSDIIKVR